MESAVGLSSLGVEALSFKGIMTNCAFEAGRMVVVIQSFNPSVSGFDGETASETFAGEELVPVVLTVGESVLKIEGVVAERTSAVSASEALRMP